MQCLVCSILVPLLLKILTPRRRHWGKDRQTQRDQTRPCGLLSGEGQSSRWRSRCGGC